MRKWTKQKEIMVGDTFTSKNYGDFVVTYVNSSLDVGVKFCATGFEKHGCAAKEVRTGYVRDPYFPTLFGVGFFGEGEYKSTETAYHVWSDMLWRCFKSNDTFRPTYQRCEISPEWYNYQVFAKWYYTNSPLVCKDVKLRLDKDILVVGNCVYGPDRCAVVPEEVNNFLVSRPRREHLPTGVAMHGAGYRAQGNSYGRHWQGTVKRTIQEAYENYKKEKEGYAKFLAQKWEGILAESVIEALRNYSVDERMY